MRVIRINEKDFNVYNELSELNLDRFQQLSSVAQKEMDPIDKSLSMIECLIDGEISKDQLEDIDIEVIDDILSAVKADIETEVPKESFTHDGVVYKLVGNTDRFIFKARQIKSISQAMKQDNIFYISKMAATLYSDGNTSENKREIIFNEYMTADYVLPFLKILIDKYA